MLRYEGRLTPLWYYFGSYTTRTQRPDGLCKVETKKDSASAQELLAKQVGTYDEPEVCTSMAPKGERRQHSHMRNRTCCGAG
jgi:hypothetical protein